MKPKNNKDVRNGYLRFSFLLAACIAWSVLFFSCFLKTSTIEVKSIMTKTLDYDRIYTKEIDLATGVDSVYQYMKLMNTSPRINDGLLQSIVSTRKMDLLKSTQNIDNADCVLYSNLLNQINTFLSIKDSIRIMKIQEDMVRQDLLQCIRDNRKTRRNMNIGTN
ncbi:type VI secretion system transmembrane protein TssQ [Bacteroides fragilis]|uniref:type VI secretion system transmembrane protein TssQ n=1 Tax=Phocaeicola coprophilus TaxID=387090 RepID=UPI003994B4D9|nr:type VI secretion system transmembrane protein TssQ [Bacteroides fragilis]